MSREHDALTHLLEAWFDTDGDDGDPVRVLEATLDQLPATPQRPASFWGARNIVTGLAVAATLVVAVIGFQLVQDANPGEPTASPSATVPEPSPSLLPALRMPGMGRNAARDYGWTGHAGASTWMHRIAGSSGEAQIVFAVADDCFALGEGPAPVSMTIAGYEALQVEPFSQPGLFFHIPDTVSAHALTIDGRTLCVYVAWDAQTTPNGVDAARAVVESIRGHAFGERGIRIVFTLDDYWDTG